MSIAHPLPAVRRSLAEGWASCPAFVMERSERLAFGQAAHLFIASYWRHLQAKGEETDMTGWTDLATEAWARTPGLLQSRFGEFMALCDHFTQTHMGEMDTLLAVEEPITRNVGWAVLVCTPDRIDRADNGDPDEDPSWLRLRDYKTEAGEMDHEFQVWFYVQMIFLSMPSVERVDVELDLIRRRMPNEPFTIERGDLDIWWEATLKALHHRLDSGPGAPVGGPACESCALRRTCGESIPSLAVAPQTQEEANALLAEHRRLAGAEAVRWALLEEFYRNHPAQPDVNGEEVGFLETRTDSVELLATAAQMRDFASGLGMDPDTYLKPVVPSDRDSRELLEAEGLLRFYRKPEVFKVRKALRGTRVHQRREADDGGEEAQP